MVTTCLRKSYEMGDYIFHQGDVPDNIYFIIEGTVSIIKEIHIVVRNRSPALAS
jgi:CRP-like cAMP-binding protein